MAWQLAINSSVLEYSFKVRLIKPEAKLSFCPVGKDQSFSTAIAAALIISYALSSWYYNANKDKAGYFRVLVPNLLGILAGDMHQGVYLIAPSKSTSIILIDDNIF
jgi:hypothetical protein